jgi:hypothetical protein
VRVTSRRMADGAERAPPDRAVMSDRPGRRPKR